jgi:serine protease Do
MSAFPDELPTAVPRAEPKPAEATADAPQTGRFNEKLPGDGAEFWGLVPENYHSAHAQGLVVWLHPAGDTMEAEVVQALEAAGKERGFIVAGVRAANIGGWTSEEEGVVKGVIDWFTERYSIDPQRVTLFGDTVGGEFAVKLAFKYRETVRGAIVSNAAVRNQPPDNDPDYRLQLLFLNPLESELREEIEQSVAGMRKLMYPTATLDRPAGQQPFAPELVGRIVEWLDALDRL